MAVTTPGMALPDRRWTWAAYLRWQLVGRGLVRPALPALDRQVIMQTLPVAHEAPALPWHRLVRVHEHAWLGIAGAPADLDLFTGDDAPRKPVRREEPLALLPLLERPRAEVLAELAAACDASGLDTDAVWRAAGLEELPALGLGRGEWWGVGALDWLQDGHDLTPRAYEAVDQILEADDDAVGLQQKAHRLLEERTS